MRELQEIRADISDIDERILNLYKERMQLTEELVEYRLAVGKKIFDFTPVEAFDFKNARVVFQGVEGAYSQQALQEFFGADTQSYHVETWRDAMEAIAGGEADYAVLPIENSSAGIVSENFDLLVEYDNCIIGEQIIKIDHCLLGLKDAPTSVTEPVLSRNHTELMLSAFGAKITSENTTASILPEPKLHGLRIEVPGDISSAAYFIAAGLLVPDSEILIRNVGINPTRDGILKAAYAMGGKIEKLNERTVSGELVCDLLVTYSHLKGTTIGGELIPTLIDEIPMIAVMAAFAEGTTIIKDAAELKVKESNRIDTVTENLKRMGADVTPTEDGMIIHGNRDSLHEADFESYLDHRIAMSFAVAALALPENCHMKDAECVNISYPTFYKDLTGLID